MKVSRAIQKLNKIILMRHVRYAEPKDILSLYPFLLNLISKYWYLFHINTIEQKALCIVVMNF